ncbi:MAG TPA: SDR family NAD(P)-dependent oxidoreductase [Candidatus Paceibacterota bacterium]|nr:SDR family NAD(P)-dependent oxidoreductase [Candidatus Paceibacterota bacterium]
MFNLSGKVALVTGARRGMGKSHALTLASQGAAVAVTDIDLGECQAVADEIIAKGARLPARQGQAAAFKLDVTNKAEIESVFDEVIKHFGKLDILVNNAGIYQDKPALEISEADWDRTININLKGQFFCAQRAAKEMAKNKRGRIINIASIASGGVGVGISGGAHYTASKGGVIGMTETLAIEFAPLGINVNAIGPGAIDTPMVAADQMSREELDAFISGVPLKRIGRAEEVSAAVIFLASDEASYVTGATLYVDGGWLAA